jgi:hypothetical protein
MILKLQFTPLEIPLFYVGDHIIRLQSLIEKRGVQRPTLYHIRFRAYPL